MVNADLGICCTFLFLAFGFQGIFCIRYLANCPFAQGSPECSGSPLLGFGSITHQMKYPGSTISIYCSYSCCGQVNVTLLLNGKPFYKSTASITDRKYTDYINGWYQSAKLTMVNFQATDPNDQGYYTCVISQGLQTLSSEHHGIVFQEYSFARLQYTISSITYRNEFGNTSSASYKTVETMISKEVNNSLQMYQLSSKRIISVFEIRYSLAGIKASLVIFQETQQLKEKEKFCEIGYNNLVGPFTSFNIVKSDAIMIDCCKKSVHGNIFNYGIITWNWTPMVNSLRTTSSMLCPYQTMDKIRYATRTCFIGFDSGASWGNPDLTGCLKRNELTQSTETLFKARVTNNSILILSQSLVTFTNDSDGSTNSSKIDSAVTVMENILMSKKADNEVSRVPREEKYDVFIEANVENVLQNLLKSVSNLLDLDSRLIASAQSQYNTSNRLLSGLDMIGKQYQISAIDQGVHDAYKNLEFFGVKVNTTINKGVQLQLQSVNNSGSSRIMRQEQLKIGPQYNTDEAIFLPINMIRKGIKSSSLASVKIYGYLYHNNKLFVEEEGNTTQMPNVVPFNVSRVLSMTILDTKLVNSKDNIEIRWPNIENVRKRLCSFWDFSYDGYGYWSQGGCAVKEFSNKDTICQCNHLTNFALLFIQGDVSSMTPQDKKALSIISYFGCGLSLTGLFLTMIALIFFGKINKILPPKILFGLCLSLSSTLLVFILGVENSANQETCRLVSALLHYCLLTTFMWNTVEGINLYLCFVTVYNTYIKCFMLKACLFASGLPLIIVAVTALVRFNMDYGTAKYCVVTGKSFYVSLLAPVIIVILINVFILSRVMYSISKSTSVNSKSKNLRKGKIWFSCATLLGLSWIFGVFSIITTNLVFQYLFCIVASFQGFHLFIFNCVLNKDVKAEMIKTLSRYMPESLRPKTSNTVDCELNQLTKRGNAQKVMQKSLPKLEASCPKLSTVET